MSQNWSQLRCSPMWIQEEKSLGKYVREFSKTTENHQKLITERILKARYVTHQNTKLCEVIKCFRTVSFTDLDQWQFVLKLSGHLSFGILSLCTKKETTLTKMYYHILSENKCSQKVTGRLTFDLLTQSSTCSSLFSSTVGIWSKKSLIWKHS